MWFQVITLEGWGRVCDQILDGYSPVSVLVFVCILLIGPFTTVKLFLAIIALELQKIHENNKWERARRIVLHWQNMFLIDAIDNWAYNAKLSQLKKTEACQVLRPCRLSAPHVWGCRL